MHAVPDNYYHITFVFFGEQDLQYLEVSWTYGLCVPVFLYLTASVPLLIVDNRQVTRLSISCSSSSLPYFLVFVILTFKNPFKEQDVLYLWEPEEKIKQWLNIDGRSKLINLLKKGSFQ